MAVYDPFEDAESFRSALAALGAKEGLSPEDIVVPLADANYKLLEQAAAEAAKEGRGHALAELARRAKAMQEAAWAIPDDEEPES